MNFVVDYLSSSSVVALWTTAFILTGLLGDTHHRLDQSVGLNYYKSTTTNEQTAQICRLFKIANMWVPAHQQIRVHFANKVLL